HKHNHRDNAHNSLAQGRTDLGLSNGDLPSCFAGGSAVASLRHWCSFQAARSGIESPWTLSWTLYCRSAACSPVIECSRATTPVHATCSEEGQAMSKRKSKTRGRPRLTRASQAERDV